MALKISKNRQAYFNQVVAERVWGSGELERKGIVAVEFLSVFFLFRLGNWNRIFCGGSKSDIGGVSAVPIEMD